MVLGMAIRRLKSSNVVKRSPQTRWLSLRWFRPVGGGAGKKEEEFFCCAAQPYKFDSSWGLEGSGGYFCPRTTCLSIIFFAVKACNFVGLICL